MLLFINTEVGEESIILQFQYISCYCLSYLGGCVGLARIISIHLMLLFIIIRNIIQTVCMDFNTSHVTVYHLFYLDKDIPNEYFNTSHVTVYLNSATLLSNSLLFQYISCYCLSLKEGRLTFSAA